MPVIRSSLTASRLSLETRRKSKSTHSKVLEILIYQLYVKLPNIYFRHEVTATRRFLGSYSVVPANEIVEHKERQVYSLKKLEEGLQYESGLFTL